MSVLSMETALHPILSALAEKQNLSAEQAERAFLIIMNGGATPAQIAAFIMGLKVKGETVEEITAGARAIRAKAQAFRVPPECIDVCGTGGDGAHTLNISTAVAFVVAACGVKVVKHGGSAVSSKSGSADVMRALGVNVEAAPAVMQRCLNELGLCFLYAPHYHKAMRHVAPVRQELKLRTVFNLLGPLVNPASPNYQLLGVYNRELVRPMAEVLRALGVQRALVVHGADGLDELSLAGENHAVELKEGELHACAISAEDAKLAPARKEALAGGNTTHNAQAMQKLFMGEKSAYRDAVVLNASAGLIVAGVAGDMLDGALLAAEALDSGAAYSLLQKFISLSNIT